MKEFAPACERNKGAILTVLRELFKESGFALEIGSGTGQHAAFFAEALPHILWQPTDLPERLSSIAIYREDAALANLLPPAVLDLRLDVWPVQRADYVVCINTIHIVAWAAVERLFAGVGRILRPGGLLYVYGPYRYRDRPLKPSNVEFDSWLKARDAASGIREFEAVAGLAEAAGLTLVEDRAMPANNRSICWRRREDA